MKGCDNDHFLGFIWTDDGAKCIYRHYQYDPAELIPFDWCPNCGEPITEKAKDFILPERKRTICTAGLGDTIGGLDPIPAGALPVMGEIIGSWGWGSFGGNLMHRMAAAPWHSGCKWSDQIDFYPLLDKWLAHDTVCD